MEIFVIIAVERIDEIDYDKQTGFKNLCDLWIRIPVLYVVLLFV